MEQDDQDEQLRQKANDDEMFLKKYDEAYAVFKANTVSIYTGDAIDLISEGHRKNYPKDIMYLKMIHEFIVTMNSDAQKRKEEEQKRKAEEQRREEEREEEKQRHIQSLIPTVSLQPNENYAPYLTYNFGHTMQPRENTPFDSHFVKDDSSMLLFMHLHGALLIGQDGNPVIMSVPGGVMLNKFSMAGTGKCHASPVSFMHHILYRLCDAVQHESPIDVETIINEANAHEYAEIVGPERALIEAPTMSMCQHSIGIEKQVKARDFQSANGQTQSYEKRFSETPYDDVPDNNKHTNGTSYVNKMYIIEHNGIARDGIFICKDWPRIGAERMDNLMDNAHFKDFIFKKYKDVKKMSNLSENLDIDGNPIVTLKHVRCSDIVEYCETFGRPNISMVDSTCSNFMAETTRSATDRQIAIASTILKKYNGAKGVNNSRNRGKATKKRRRVKDKNKRTRGR